MGRRMKTRKSRKMRNKRSQKMYLQKGCARSKYGRPARRVHSSRCRCKKCGLKFSQSGGCGCGLPLQSGGCGTCGTLVQNGGCGCGLFKGGSGVPAPLVGTPWTPEISGWPGVAGIPGQPNYLSLNKYENGDPQTQGIQFNRDNLTHRGGRGRHGRSKKGGTLIPQDLLNIGRTLTYGMGSAYNNVNGYAQPVSPLPYQDQLRNTSLSKF